MTLLIKHSKLTVLDSKTLINTRNMIPDFNRLSSNNKMLNSKIATFRFQAEKKEFIMIPTETNYTPYDDKPLYRIVNHMFQTTQTIPQNNDTLQIKIQRRKANPYSYSVPTFFPLQCDLFCITCINLENIQSNSYELLHINQITKQELSPGFMFIINNAENIDIKPSILQVDNSFEDAIEDTIVISYYLATK